MEGEQESLSKSGTLDQLLSSISSDSFWSWYRERETTRNIENGTPQFNRPSPPPSPNQHTPSRLLQCHRRVYYQLNNAPAETTPPEGLYWFGSRFETDIIVPFLRKLVSPDLYVRNSIWVDFEVESSNKTLRFKGKTDPVVVDVTGEPILLTEIKTTSSVESVDEVRPRHRAQVHACMYGLSQEFNTSVEDTVVIYGDRKTLDFRSFYVPFDPEFWHDHVLGWIEENSKYRRTEKLPPAKPEAEWECSICPFQRRCGKSDDPYFDLGFFGLLPLFSGYSKDRVEAYLRAHPNAKLTPTLAYQYSTLADEVGAYDWVCEACSSSYSVDEIEWAGSVEQPPLCPVCCQNEIPAPLSDPSPRKQKLLN
ncbi:CRISPR-associated protein Cas4 [Haladaptatus cibarius]|uniref:CRISPR-associated protein Cas4 n=1 Tax=Haladaptatus cibarius TaxID=453847 RepID=UPI00130E230F|nr:PD-(D/E)XK nuclease family protein [Haladaptatus cibarius]